ncbi:hypothetical protein [Clostridium saccharoperbutylacetonicum]|uniref:hypothetical protein n=1 Tax=Clostridium saccharoperbutylacetonicum TaxID=36745 RepID=UPI000983FCAC|nr:hypothetical protein [Clostridium saccharoperbutylacetonicum]AQR96429.1 hypothetical protein CLSAP_37530 [Clostridium saccharoperbutylacetonicum]NSB32303.1 hypothetical protein [Clostridium saccharoperbutylacetonicum]
MKTSIKLLAAVAAITLIGTTIPVKAAEIYTDPKPVVAYGEIPKEQKVEDLKLELTNKMKYLYADNDTKRLDILNQAKFLINNTNHYITIDIANFNLVPATIDKEGSAVGAFTISDSKQANLKFLIPFNISIKSLDTEKEKELKEKVTKIINSLDINRNTNYKEVQSAITDGLADNSIDVKVSNVYSNANNWSLGNYSIFVYLSNKDKTIDTELCVKGYIYPTLNATDSLNNIASNLTYSLKNIYDKDLSQGSVQGMVDKLLKGTSITAKISDYVQIPATATTFGEVLFSITLTDSRNNSTIIKYFDSATDAPKYINNNQTYRDYNFGITMLIANYKSANNNTTLSDIERLISGTIQSEFLGKCIDSYSFKPATTSSDGLIEFKLKLTSTDGGFSIDGYRIRIPKLT